MLLKKRIITGSLIILIISFSSIGFGQEPPKGIPEVRAVELLDLLNSIEGVPAEPPRIFTTQEGYLRFIMAPPSTHFAVEPSRHRTPEEAAYTFLEQWRNLFVNESADISFDTIRVKTSNSRSYVRYQQTYADLEVFGAQMIVEVDETGNIGAVISDIMRDTTELDTGKVSLNPSIDSSTAQEKAIEFLTTQHPQLEFEASLATLMVFCSSVVGNTGTMQLVWRIEVGNVGDPIIKDLVLVDAHIGDITFHYSLIYDAKYRMIYDYEGRTYSPILVRWEGQNPYGIADVDDTYDYLGDTYDFYYNHHGRDGYDNAGANLIAEVRYGVSGAWWYGSFMRIAQDEVTG